MADLDAVQRNLRHIMGHEAKPNPQAVGSQTITRGFEKVAFPKIVSKVNGQACQGAGPAWRGVRMALLNGLA